MADIKANELQMRRKKCGSKDRWPILTSFDILEPPPLNVLWEGNIESNISILKNVTKITKVISQVNELHSLSPLFKEFDRLYQVLRKGKMICSKLEIENVLRTKLRQSRLTT